MLLPLLVAILLLLGQHQHQHQQQQQQQALSPLMMAWVDCWTLLWVWDCCQGTGEDTVSLP
jgi:hypothetical protein